MSADQVAFETLLLQQLAGDLTFLKVEVRMLSDDMRRVEDNLAALRVALEGLQQTVEGVVDRSQTQVTGLRYALADAGRMLAALEEPTGQSTIEELKAELRAALDDSQDAADQIERQVAVLDHALIESVDMDGVKDEWVKVDLVPAAAEVAEPLDLMPEDEMQPVAAAPVAPEPVAPEEPTPLYDQYADPDVETADPPPEGDVVHPFEVQFPPSLPPPTSA